MKSRFVAISLLGLLVGAFSAPAPAQAIPNAGVSVIIAPDGSGVGLGECEAAGVTQNATTMDLVVRGSATLTGARSISLTCHLWQRAGGKTIRHCHVPGFSIVPFTAQAAGICNNFRLATYNICPEVEAVTLFGAPVNRRCPPHN